jgi:hypothetical protein
MASAQTAAKRARTRKPNADERAQIAQQIAQETGVNPTVGRTHAAKAGVSLKPRTGWIECVNPMKRADGTRGVRLSINKHTYDFLPNEFGDYVTEVPFAQDYASILSIGAGYKPYDAAIEHPEGPPAREVPASRIPSARGTPRSKGDKHATKKARGAAKPATPRPGKAATSPAPAPAGAVPATADPALD